PSECGEGPERGGEPGVEDVRILIQANIGGEMMSAACFRLASRNVHIAVPVIPCRDAMSPPELAADAPVFDVAHPFEVGLGPVLRHEPRAPALDCRDGRSRE